jgi:methylated-DNA-[protein]-cysteine S-methyltransferase
VQRFATKLTVPMGQLAVIVDERQRVTHLYFVKDPTPGGAARLVDRVAPGAVWSLGQCEPAVQQLTEYFQHRRRSFDLPLAPEGGEFQQQVWALLQQIPFGQTRSYGQLATQLGLANGARAVGRANATNPISIIIPCHRVIGSTGKLTGYAGGLDVKDALLRHEGVLEPLLFSAA